MMVQARRQGWRDVGRARGLHVPLKLLIVGTRLKNRVRQQLFIIASSFPRNSIMGTKNTQGASAAWPVSAILVLRQASIGKEMAGEMRLWWWQELYRESNWHC
jgi:hypothetical protein